VAVKLALADPEATVTDDGTVSAALSLVSVTVWPSPSAAVLNVAVQLSVPAPVIESLWQLMDCKTAVPVPLEVLGLFENLPASVAPPHASKFTERKLARRVSKAALCLSRLGAARFSCGETMGLSAFLLERAFSKKGRVGSVSRACFMY
jgi:hypothetical protein